MRARASVLCLGNRGPAISGEGGVCWAELPSFAGPVRACVQSQVSRLHNTEQLSVGRLFLVPSPASSRIVPFFAGQWHHGSLSSPREGLAVRGTQGTTGRCLATRCTAVYALRVDVPPCTHYKSMYRRARTTSPVHTCPCSWWGRDGNGGESLGDFLGPTVMPSIATCLPSANLPVIALHSSPSSPASCKSLDPRFACPHRLASACLGLLTTHLLNSPCSILIYST